jgi:flavin-binding protein dodecin
MSVARVTEITSQSARSFEDAIRQGIKRANQTLRNVSGAWVKEQQIAVTDGKITGYRVNMLVTFILDAGVDPDDLAKGGMAMQKRANASAKKASASKTPAKKAAPRKARKARR